MDRAKESLHGSVDKYSAAQLAASVMEVCLAANRWKSPAVLGERVRKVDQRRAANEINDEEHLFLRTEAMGLLPVEDWPETQRLTRTGGFRECVISAIKQANPQEFVTPINIPDDVRAAYNFLLMKH